MGVIEALGLYFMVGCLNAALVEGLVISRGDYTPDTQVGMLFTSLFFWPIFLVAYVLLGLHRALER
jgi:hypothetical protein